MKASVPGQTSAGARRGHQSRRRTRRRGALGRGAQIGARRANGAQGGGGAEDALGGAILRTVPVVVMVLSKGHGAGRQQRTLGACWSLEVAGEARGAPGQAAEAAVMAVQTRAGPAIPRPSLPPASARLCLRRHGRPPMLSTRARARARARLPPIRALTHRCLASMAPAARQASRALLLLPPAPDPPSYAALRAAYHLPLLKALTELANPHRRPQEPALLEVALPCPHLYGRLGAPRAALYPTTQQLVADLYKLVCVSAASEAIDTEGPDSLDVRLVLLAYPRDSQLPPPQPDSSAEQDRQGPALDLYTLARNPTPWDTVYAVESEQGEAVLNNFLAVAKAPKRLARVQGGIVQVDPAVPQPASTEASSHAVHHHSVAVGGTFDHLHIGHKLLLTMFAFTVGRGTASGAGSNSSAGMLTVGITGDAMLKNKKFADHVESWASRQAAVHRFLASLLCYGHADEAPTFDEVNEAGPNGHALHFRCPSGLVIRYVEISDPFGPTITDQDISALVISHETRGGGVAVNDKRSEKGWKALEVFEVAVLDGSEDGSVDETFASKLSSTEIRRKVSEGVQVRARA